MLSPICLFTYNRLAETKQTVFALQENFLAKESALYIFSDGAKNEEGTLKVNEVRSFIKGISGFKSITIFESETNKGLANAIISGVTMILERHESVIVLEDDLVTSPNFLDYMNECLEHFSGDDSIISISGHSLDFDLSEKFTGDTYLNGRADSWGWATWKDRWDLIDWEIKDWDHFKKDRIQQKKFNANGSDMFSMLCDYMEGRNNSWAIRFCYTQFKLNKQTVYPIVSKVDNIGFGANSTHCNCYNRFKIDFDNTLNQNRKFVFCNELNSNDEIKRLKANFFNINIRVKSKLMTAYLKLNYFFKNKLLKSKTQNRFE